MTDTTPRVSVLPRPSCRNLRLRLFPLASAVEDILSIIEGEEWIVIMTLVTRTAKAVQRHRFPWKQRPDCRK